MSIREGFQSYELFQLAVMRGEIFAEPSVNRLTGRATMKIMGWNPGSETLDVIDMKALPGEYGDVYDIPTVVLNCVFFSDSEHTGIQFSQGGTYSLNGNWMFPFSGDRLGTWVKRYDANAERESINEHAGAANA